MASNNFKLFNTWNKIHTDIATSWSLSVPACDLLNQLKAFSSIVISECSVITALCIPEAQEHPRPTIIGTLMLGRSEVQVNRGTS